MSNKQGKHPGGRPPKYKSPEELQDRIEDYFTYCKENEVKITTAGLAYHLGFESRQSLYDYCKHEEYSYIIKRVRLRLEAYYEAKVQGNCPTGPIFVLKNMGWKDEHHNVNKNENVNYDFSNLSEEEAKKIFNDLKDEVGK